MVSVLYYLLVEFKRLQSGYACSVEVASEYSIVLAVMISYSSTTC